MSYCWPNWYFGIWQWRSGNCQNRHRYYFYACCFDKIFTLLHLWSISPYEFSLTCTTVNANRDILTGIFGSPDFMNYFINKGDLLRIYETLMRNFHHYSQFGLNFPTHCSPVDTFSACILRILSSPIDIDNKYSPSLNICFATTSIPFSKPIFAQFQKSAKPTI